MSAVSFALIYPGVNILPCLSISSVYKWRQIKLGCTRTAVYVGVWRNSRTNNERDTTGVDIALPVFV